MRNQNSDLQMLHSVALPLIHRDSVVSARSSTKFLYDTHPAYSKDQQRQWCHVCKDGKFWARQGNRERFFFCLVTSMGQRKNFKSPWGIEPQTFRFCAPVLYHWSTETLWLVRPTLWSLYMTFGDSEVFLWPMLLIRQKTYYSISLLSSKLPIFLILRSLLILLFLSNAHWIWGEKTMYQLFHRNIHLFSF